ncbi:hypothetical protein [Candidatus Amarolinea dominans]|uniref:hypothetical protein n=1 Tax=Candidatus Amarolinea dominans TaxID=3140696 RepID=UPI0031CCAF25
MATATTIQGFAVALALGVPNANTPFAEAQWDAVMSTAIWNGSQTPGRCHEGGASGDREQDQADEVICINPPVEWGHLHLSGDAIETLRYCRSPDRQLVLTMEDSS